MRTRQAPIKRINPSGEVVWVARPRDESRKAVHLGTRKLKRDAQALIDAWVAEGATPTSRSTFGEYTVDWTERWPRSRATNRTNSDRIRWVLDVKIEGRALRGWPLADLRRKHGYALFDSMLRHQGRSVNGARNVIRTLSAMAEDAITDEVIGVNPFKGLKLRDDDRRATKQPREKCVWTWDEMHAFAAAAGPYEPMIRMLADCGLRIGELLAMQRDLQDLKGGVFTVHGSAWNGDLVLSSREKKHDRQGPIPPTCLELLRAMPKRIDSPWLFPTPGSRRTGKTGFDRPGGLLWRYDNWRRQVWYPTCEAAGIHPTPQQFRASYNSLLLAGGIDRADLADMLGHSEAVNASHYTLALRRSGDLVRQVIG